MNGNRKIWFALLLAIAMSLAVPAVGLAEADYVFGSVNPLPNLFNLDNKVYKLIGNEGDLRQYSISVDSDYQLIVEAGKTLRYRTALSVQSYGILNAGTIFAEDAGKVSTNETYKMTICTLYLNDGTELNEGKGALHRIYLGTGSSSVSLTAASIAEYWPDWLKRDGYVFNGWSKTQTDTSGSITDIAYETPKPDAHRVTVDLYATWKKVPVLSITDIQPREMTAGLASELINPNVSYSITNVLQGDTVDLSLDFVSSADGTISKGSILANSSKGTGTGSATIPEAVLNGLGVGCYWVKASTAENNGYLPSSAHSAIPVVLDVKQATPEYTIDTKAFENRIAGNDADEVVKVKIEKAAFIEATEYPNVKVELHDNNGLRTTAQLTLQPTQSYAKNDTYDYTFDGGIIKTLPAGDYTVKASSIATRDNNASAASELTVTIAKAEPDILVNYIQGDNKHYAGQFTAGIDVGVSISYESDYEKPDVYVGVTKSSDPSITDPTLSDFIFKTKMGTGTDVTLSDANLNKLPTGTYYIFGFTTGNDFNEPKRSDAARLVIGKASPKLDVAQNGVYPAGDPLYVEAITGNLTVTIGNPVQNAFWGATGTDRLGVSVLLYGSNGKLATTLTNQSLGKSETTIELLEFELNGLKPDTYTIKYVIREDVNNNGAGEVELGTVTISKHQPVLTTLGTTAYTVYSGQVTNVDVAYALDKVHFNTMVPVEPIKITVQLRDGVNPVATVSDAERTASPGTVRLSVPSTLAVGNYPIFAWVQENTYNDAVAEKQIGVLNVLQYTPGSYTPPSDPTVKPGAPGGSGEQLKIEGTVGNVGAQSASITLSGMRSGYPMIVKAKIEGTDIIVEIETDENGELIFKFPEGALNGLTEGTYNIIVYSDGNAYNNKFSFVVGTIVIGPVPSVVGDVTMPKKIKVTKGFSLQLVTLVNGNTMPTFQKIGSKNKKIATLDANGVLTGVKKGKVEVSYKLNGKTKKCTVTVVKNILDWTKPPKGKKNNITLSTARLEYMHGYLHLDVWVVNRTKKTLKDIEGLKYELYNDKGDVLISVPFNLMRTVKAGQTKFQCYDVYNEALPGIDVKFLDLANGGWKTRIVGWEDAIQTGKAIFLEDDEQGEETPPRPEAEDGHEHDMFEPAEPDEPQQPLAPVAPVAPVEPSEPDPVPPDVPAVAPAEIAPVMPVMPVSPE